MRVYLFFALLIVSGFSFGNGTLIEAKFHTLYSGSYLFYENKDMDVVIEVHNEEELIKFWKEFRFNEIYELPKIDFKQTFIIAVFDKLRGYSGYNVGIKSIVIDKSNESRPVQINVEVPYPGSAGVELTAFSRSFEIVVVER